MGGKIMTMLKYNWSIIGHEKQLIEIEHDILSSRLSHAYLLAGINSVGKYTVALKMAGILQCENDFCHKCSTCVQVKKGSHIDTVELKDNGESIKIEEIRNLIERLQMTPQAKYKILLIQSAERMTTEAANSFLKILEEPPPRTIFILTTNNIREILPTIISRVRTVKFGPVSTSYLEAKLKNLYPDKPEDLIRQISLFSMGKTGQAVHLMENPDALLNYQKIYNDVQNFLERKNIADRFAYVEDLLAEEKQIETFCSILGSVLRTKVLEGSSEKERYIKTLLKIDDTGILLKKNVNSRLVLENLMLAI